MPSIETPGRILPARLSWNAIAAAVTPATPSNAATANAATSATRRGTRNDRLVGSASSETAIALGFLAVTGGSPPVVARIIVGPAAGVQSQFVLPATSAGRGRET